ncbi:MAG: hypothetical protein U5R49_12185 [Deltaproteobacteria bacterium]|nr:hypothetical protein [Deltaproteobacteria bacterium]
MKDFFESSPQANNDQQFSQTTIKNVQFRKEKFPNTVLEIRTGENVQWEDIKITFISDDEILIQYHEEGTHRKFNYAGFENRKSGKPIQSWLVFCETAKRGKGGIRYTFTNRKKIEKIAHELNRKLCELFPDIPEKPIKLYKKNQNVYKATFQINSNI